MKEYVLCPKCLSMYKLEDCFLRTSTGLIESKKCHYVAYPDHPHATRITQCNTTLLKQVKHRATYKYVPKKYNGVISSLKALIDRDGILQLCNHWRNRTHIEDTLADVTDGQVWKDLITVNGRPFLDVPNNLALMLNVDWFTPYERSRYSVGVIYLTVLNLPRSVRYKLENVLVIGCIPGPKEPKHHINTYLTLWFMN